MSMFQYFILIIIKRLRLYFFVLILCLLFWPSLLLSQEKIIFLHIPKSGGVTVSSLLMNAYNTDAATNVDFGKIDPFYYSFHFSLFEIKQKFNVSHFKIITFLRHPIERVLSEYYYCIRKHQGNPHILAAHKIPEQGTPIETISNLACKMLSGLDDRDETISIETHLAHAKQTLKDLCFFVGITERMDQSIPLLFSQLGWKIPEKIPHFNTTDRDIVFFPQTLEGIAARNWADIELYEYAVILFDLNNQELQSRNTSTQEHIEFVKEYHYDFNQRLEGNGWALREIENSTQMTYRWATEDNETEIDFYLLPDQNYLLKTKIFLQPIFCKQFQIFINSAQIATEFHSFRDNNFLNYRWMEYQAIIPRAHIKKGQKTKIRFKMTPPHNCFLLELYQKSNPYQSIFSNFIRGKFACKTIDLLPITIDINN